VRSPRKRLIERLEAGLSETERHHDVACRLRVYRRDANGDAQPAEWLPKIYGGRYDTWTRQYGGPAEKVHEVKIHEGQLPLIGEIGTDQRHVANVGPPGGGKTEGVVSVAVALSARRCNAIGGMVAPIGDKRKILWRKYLARVEPFGWISRVSEKNHEIRLKNGTLLQFVAMKKQSRDASSPAAGLDWHWCVVDEEAYIDDDAMREVDARGRINPKYQIFSSGTNESIHHWQMRLQRYHASPRATVIRYRGLDNAFTRPEHWEALKADWSDEDYRRFINCEEVPREGRVFPRFSYGESTATTGQHIGPTPETRWYQPAGQDITAELTYAKWQASYRWIVGWDPGVVHSASVILKAYRGTGVDERNWYAIDEVTTKDGTTEFHARDLLRWFHARGVSQTDVLVIGDPHENKDTDRSDYIQMRAAGFTTKPSNGGDRIEIRHRVAMTNALLADANGRRRLHLAPSIAGAPQANKLAESLGTLMWGSQGMIDYKHKTELNVAHWADALGYGLFPFERMRGGYRATEDKQSSTAPGAWRSRMGSGY
jgi:hypothetical protein